MRHFSLVRSFLIFGIGLMLCGFSSCGAVVTPAPTPTPPPLPACSVTIGTDATTWTGTFKALGKDITKDNPNFLVNGTIQTKSSYTLQPDDYVVLENEPKACDYSNGPYSVAKRVDFGSLTADPKSSTAWWREIDALSKSKGPITLDRLMAAAKGTCNDVRWGYQNKKLGFDDNIYSGGCLYPTYVKYSLPDGSVSCNEYPSIIEAYEASASIPNLDKVGWYIIFTDGKIVQDRCKQQ